MPAAAYAGFWTWRVIRDGTLRAHAQEMAARLDFSFASQVISNSRVGRAQLSPSGADAMFMRRAFQLAENGTPAPNPHVGALVVQAGRVVGSGYHARAGSAHAEVIALLAAGARARNGTLYVTLEPCNHRGRTPPCVDALLEAGIARVVIGCLDPNPFVAGGGAAHLAEAGISVELGPWPEDARRLISDWAATFGPPVTRPRGF